MRYVTQAEFNRTLQEVQEVCGLCPDAIKRTVIRDVAKPGWRPVNTFMRAWVNDPLADGHSGKIRFVDYDTGSGLRLFQVSDPMTTDARYCVYDENVGRILYGNPFA